MSETFIIDTEFQRDALYAGIWTRLCCEIRGHAEGHGVDEYIEHFAVRRGDPTKLLGYLDEDIRWLSEARDRLRAVEATPVGSDVELDDVARFMPVAWQDDDQGTRGHWIYSDSEAEKARSAQKHVVQVRRVLGGDA